MTTSKQAVEQLEAYAQLGGSMNLRATKDGDSIMWMGQMGSPDGKHAVTGTANNLADLADILFKNMEGQGVTTTG